MPSSRLSNGWLVRNGAPVLVAMDPRRGSESLRFRGAAVAVASSRSCSCEPHRCCAVLVLKLDFQNSCYVAVSCSVAAPRLAAVRMMISSDAVLSIGCCVQLHRPAACKSKLAACKTLASKLGTRMQRASILRFANGPKRSAVHAWGPKKEIFNSRPRAPTAMAAAPLNPVNPCQEVSLGSPRVGTIHVQAPTPHAPPLRAYLANSLRQTLGQSQVAPRALEI